MFKEKKENIALFGGSFDPPHFGHIEIINKALDKLDIDKLVVVPTYLNPFKEKFFLPPRERFKRLKKLLIDFPDVEVNSFEIDCKRVVPTIQTMEYLEQKYNVKYIIIGADNLENIHRWRDFQKLNSKVIWVVATRDGYKIDTQIINQFKILEVNAKISSTEIRQKGNSI